MLFDDLEVIVIETDEAETQSYHHQHPDVGIVQFRPEEGGGRAVAKMIIRPPMVGVPFLEKWDWGPSSRTYWPICMRLELPMNQGPPTREMTRAVRMAKMVRKVM